MAQARNQTRDSANLDVRLVHFEEQSWTCVELKWACEMKVAIIARFGDFCNQCQFSDTVLMSWYYFCVTAAKVSSGAKQ